MSLRVCGKCAIVVGRHGRHDLRPDAHPTDGVVHRVLDVRLQQGRRVRPDGAAQPEIGSYQRAWAIPHRLRSALVGPGRDRLAGPAEVDATFLGGQEPGLRSGRARGKKVLTGIAVEVRGSKRLGRCRMAPLADGSAKSLHCFVTDHVEPGATVITDDWNGYLGLDNLGYLHDRRSQRAARLGDEDPHGLLPAGTPGRLARQAQATGPSPPPLIAESTGSGPLGRGSRSV